MRILLLSAGGGGGNILRSVRALFDRDVAVARQSDPDYAGRLASAITTRYLDTNAFSLADVPADERLLIGPRTTGRLGARHNPDVARQALDESGRDVEALMAGHAVVVLIGTGGKGTGAGTMLPLAQMARRQRKLVLPIFVRPSFERHEVDKRRYDHALAVGGQFDTAGIRLIEIVNDRGYDDAAPRAQHVVWEQMNVPIARGLRGLIYVLWDLSQVDPSDLSILLAGSGRLRLGFGEIASDADADPSDGRIDEAVRRCWENPYYAFSRPPGTSIVCIQGDWSNVADAKIKSRLAGYVSAAGADAAYTPLYTRVARAPRPWGVTALFGEHTGGHHAPVDIDWSFGQETIVQVRAVVDRGAPDERVEDGQPPVAATDGATEAVAMPAMPSAHPPAPPVERPRPSVWTPASLWEFAAAVNRSDPAALALANDGMPELPIEGAEVRKLLGTMWFRGIVPRLGPSWRARLLEALATGVVIPNHMVRAGRQTKCLSELRLPQLQEIASASWMPDAARLDIDLLVAVGRCWGEDAIGRLCFGPALQPPSRMAALLQQIRR